MAGLAATIHLTRAGLSVICLEPREDFAEIVGESLDWSAPALLAQLGMPMEMLVERGAATFKRHATITSLDGVQQEYQPGAWLEESPWNVELRTLHLDRQQIHHLLMGAVRALGVVPIRDRAIEFFRTNDRILSVLTSGKKRIEARWVVDASGAAASLLGREFKVPAAVYGPRKNRPVGSLPDGSLERGNNAVSPERPRRIHGMVVGDSGSPRREQHWLCCAGIAIQTGACRGSQQRGDVGQADA